ELGPQRVGAAEGAVAADHHEAVDPLLAHEVHGFLTAAFLVELWAAVGLQDRAAAEDDVRHRFAVHHFPVALEQARVALAHAEHGDAVRDPVAHHAPERGVHAGSIAPAAEDGEGPDLRLMPGELHGLS